MNKKKPPALVKALQEFNLSYRQDLNDEIRVTHAPGDVRAWTGNDFFEEGFYAGLRAAFAFPAPTDSGKGE